MPVITSARIVALVLLLAMGCSKNGLPEGEASGTGVKIMPGFLVETQELASLIGAPGVVVIDARAEEKYLKFHIPGAVNIPKNLLRAPEEIQYKNANGFAVSPRKAQALFGAVGIGKNTRVIAYDSVSFPDASIVWTLLKQFGHDNVQVLNGGFEKWVAQKHPVNQGAHTLPQSAIFKPVPRPEMVATAKWIMDRKDEIILLDMRSFAEYMGIDSAGNKRGGSIPGAVNIEWTELAGDSSVKPPEEIKRVLEKYGISPDSEIVTYCNWGIGRSTYGFFLLKMLGYEKVRVYGGSMEEWSARVETKMGDIKNIPANI